ncbi:medium-chain acyl-CoA ligase ACSF2, mitochondrial [Nephila pilipes]|uniref:Medium-chain acyl-CoA ligase ACSF2, mitochondrial n=1 Tax=Nephila pilipes TaxID=299642 RepID=A0A8X6IRY0_NEPPI|nr:medium-chain acyl-CoA ligase ACSF2, mitochondrial [Nephila pilipes]
MLSVGPWSRLIGYVNGSMYEWALRLSGSDWVGTTGAPKGAVLNHHSLINNCLIGGRRLRCHLSKQVLLIQVPMFHSYGSVFASIMPILYQCTSVFPCLGFDAVESLKAIQKYKCTISYGTPTMYVDLIRNYKSGNYDISSLKLVISGGAATPETLMKDIQNQLNVPYLQVGYGSTELSPGIAFAKANDSDNAAKGILETIEYVEVKIINDKRHIVPVNTQGEICARGHVTFMGYWGDEEKTKEVLDETGWYHTGDLGVMDEDGCLRIVGRIKDMIIRGGENIYPVEVEEYLSTHPSIQEVHICGVPDERLGEEACAWIHLKEGAELTEQEVKEFCKGKISHFKIPRYVMFVQGFPKTHTGKIKKFEMSKVSKEKLNL